MAKIKCSEETLEMLRRGVDDENMWHVLEENYVAYLSVLRTGKYDADDYINAVKFVSFKLMGNTNFEAYKLVFPERYERIMRQASGKKCSEADYFAGFVSAYNRTELVSKIMEQSIIPSYVLNAPLHQRAINELASIITDGSVKGMAKVKACEVLLNYTKPPETIKHELNLGKDGIDTIGKLKEALTGIAEKLQKGIDSDVITLKQVAEGEFVVADDEVQSDDDRPKECWA